MRLLSLRSSLLLLRRRNGSETPPHSDVISVTENITLTAADSGKTYSLDGVNGQVNLPLRSSLSAGWTINVQCTFTGRIAWANFEIGEDAFSLEGYPYDGVQLDSLDATVTITYDGAYFQAVANSGTVTGYYD